MVIESPTNIEESIAKFVENERKYVRRERIHFRLVDLSAPQTSASIPKVDHKYFILSTILFIYALFLRLYYYFYEYITQNFELEF